MEILSIGQVAKLDLPLQNIITAHNPTMAEALKLVAISFTKDVNRLSCCAS